jgi:hypothetical protein
MRRLLAVLIWLLLVVLHAPTPAQAVMYSFFPDLFASHAPATLAITGIALLTLPRLAVRRRRM